MPVAGLVKLRKWQGARQAVEGTVVAATKAYPWRGVPDVDLQWTDPDVDAGSIYPTVAPIRQGDEATGPITDNGLEFNTIPALMSGFFGGDVEPTASGTGGLAKTWTHDPDPTDATGSQGDPWTWEFGDDVENDWYQFGDSVLESFEVVFPEQLVAATASATWRFGSVASESSTDQPVTGTVPTVGLSVDTAGAKIYGKDTAIYIASSVAGLGAGQVSDALYTATLRFGGDLDLKRWMNGSQSFAINEIVRATGSIEVELTFAKTSDIVGTGSESDAWMSDDSVNRYLRLITTSTTLIAGTAVPYKWTQTMPIRYYTRTEGEIGGNTTVVLTGHAFYDPDDFTGVYTSAVVCDMTNADLGATGS
jgi:hypothetical protein